jgi:hypothetical protein
VCEGGAGFGGCGNSGRPRKKSKSRKAPDVSVTFQFEAFRGEGEAPVTGPFIKIHKKTASKAIMTAWISTLPVTVPVLPNRPKAAPETGTHNA